MSLAQFGRDLIGKGGERGILWAAMGRGYCELCRMQESNSVARKGGLKFCSVWNPPQL
jgi:hypothetical protein